ncbi:MAG TPA: histidine kinase [Nitrospira sp.]|nr:histidine kinase [Nitrospira sp.]
MTAPTDTTQDPRTEPPRRKTILVAVTDIFFYTKIRDALRNDYRLDRARFQPDVAEKTALAPPSAVVLNMNDDVINAFQVLEFLKRNDELKSVPVLAFANHEEVDTWNRAKALGVTKIVSRNEFSSRTKSLVDEMLSHDA